MGKSVLVVAGVCLLTLIMLVTSAVSPGQGYPPLVPHLSREALLLAWLVLGAGLLLVTLLELLERLRSRREKRRTRLAEREKPVALWPLFAVALAALLIGFGAISLVASFLRAPETEQASQAPEGRQEEIEETAEETAEPEPGLMINMELVGAALLAVSAVVLALLLVLHALRRLRAEAREREVLERREALRDDLARGLRVSLEAILAESDCRRAVIACYARMEQSFSRAGLPRKEAETPLEFLDRALRDSRLEAGGRGGRPAAATLHELTRLYEVARFSEHPLGVREKAAAVDAIRSLETLLAREPSEGARRTA